MNKLIRTQRDIQCIWLLPNPKQRLKIYTSDLVIMRRLITHVVTIITRGMDKLEMYSPVYCIKIIEITDSILDTRSTKYFWQAVYISNIFKCICNIVAMIKESTPTPWGRSMEDGTITRMVLSPLSYRYWPTTINVYWILCVVHQQKSC